MKRFLSLLALLAAPAAAQFISHPPGTALADLGTCSSAREGLLRKVNNGDAASDCDPTGTGDWTVLCKCTETATDTYEWQAVPNIDEAGNLVLDGQLTTGESTAPGVSFRDSDSIASPADVNSRLHTNLTDVGDGTEDADIWLAGQRAGTEVNHITVDADLGITLGNAGNASLTVTTDSTGTAEGALPAGSIDSTEILDATIDALDLNADARKEKCGHLIIESIAVTDEWVVRLPPFPGTMDGFYCESYAGTTFSFDVCDGEDIGDDTCTTSILGSALACSTSGGSDTGLSSAGFAARDKVSIVITAQTGDPTGDIYIECTRD